ncbi:MAG: hypothetical protein HWE39_13850 [Oceanospirillaceae bacterium]|nr:hypothetical protein [Oceanospirillaceae bacterium]
MNRCCMLLAGLLVGGGACAAQGPSELMFEVRREGETIGSHCVEFSRRGDLLDVEVAMELQVPLPLWFDYRYSYRASERWQGGRLQALEIVIDDGGKQRRIEAYRRAGILEVATNDGQWQVPGDLMTSNHWNPDALGEPHLLNTLTGRVSRIDSEYLGSDRVTIGDRELDVRRYRLGGELGDSLVWYDQGGSWRGLEFSARDGSRIRLYPLSTERVAALDPSETPWSRNPLCRPGQQSG